MTAASRAASGPARPEGALPRLVSTYLVKRRLVLAQRVPRAAAPPASTALAVCIYSGATPERHIAPQQLTTLAETIGAERLRSRLLDPDITLVLGVDRETQRPTGFRWVLHPSSRTAWHDNIPVRPGEALGFNAYTYPGYRRQGLYQELVGAGNRHLLETLRLERVAIVVEAGNRASLGANLAAGLEVTGANYLLKCLGHNVLSVFRDRLTGELSVHYVFRNEKGRRL